MASRPRSLGKTRTIPRRRDHLLRLGRNVGAEMASIDDRARHRFFYDNMAELLGPPLVPSL